MASAARWRTKSYTSAGVRTAWSAAMGTWTASRTWRIAVTLSSVVGCSTQSMPYDSSAWIMRMASGTLQAQLGSTRRRRAPMASRTAAVFRRSASSPRPTLR